VNNTTISIQAPECVFVNGSWVKPSGNQVLEVISPVTEETIMTFPDGNDTIYGLHGAIYIADVERGYQVARRIRSGSVTVNGMIVDYKMPFGGFKQSGIGREGGIEGLQNYFETKTIYM
jgi:acyl-CoA reductase-like NAD-dependent aldehyde dehydrogenase